MPCDTVQTTKCEFDLNHTDLNIFTAAMTQLGYTRVGDSLVFRNMYGSTAEFKNGKLTQTFRYGGQLDVNTIKREYSKETLKTAKKRYGWEIETDGTGLKGKLKKRS